jgi:hypothetical protein
MSDKIQEGDTGVVIAIEDFRTKAKSRLLLIAERDLNEFEPIELVTQVQGEEDFKHFQWLIRPMRTPRGATGHRCPVAPAALHAPLSCGVFNSPNVREFRS